MIALSLAAGVGCTTGEIDDPLDQISREREVFERIEQTLSATNQGGTNLAGANLAGSNLAGSNLAGANMGGTNLAGSNLAGSNLAGTNLGGNNLGGNNLAGSNLAGSNLAGSNLAGNNLAGSNLAGSNLAGSNLAGSNLAGNNLAGSNLGATSLSSNNTALDIHKLGSSTIKGMLYSGEDIWTPQSARCIVLGIGSTAFPKLLGQQSTNARMYAALGKLPWGFASVAGGAINLEAWEAVVWGDKTYCTFVMAAPPGTAWSGMAGFIKSVFRWNAPASQSLDISGIEASAPYDPTLSTGISTHTGMMNSAAHWKSGKLTAKAFVAGELAFVSATTNNQTVLVDFASWVQDKDQNALILGNVQTVNPPTHTDSVYIALDNGDGTVQVIIDDAAFATSALPAGMADSYTQLNGAYSAWKNGQGPKPIPRRCGGSLNLAKVNPAEPVPWGKCDDGLSWSGSCYQGSLSWSALTGITGGPNSYMQLTQPGGQYKRGPIVAGACTGFKTVLSETYVHLWDKNYDLNRAFGGSASAGTPPANSAEAPANAVDNRSAESNGTKWCTIGNPNTSGTPVTFAYKFPSPLAITSYTVTSANDLPTRDPRDWQVQGCSGSCNVGSDTGWKTLDTRSGQSFPRRWLTNTYSFANSTAYSQIRIRISAANGTDGLTQAGEFQFFDSNQCLPQSDAALCASYGKNCGSFSAVDNCGATRQVVSCGSCSSPNSCAGGGTANVCGAGSSATCYTPYSKNSCLGYWTGSRVSSGGRNWTCTNGNCKNCAVYTTCAPGASGCPWGVVWQDNGPCR